MSQGRKHERIQSSGWPSKAGKPTGRFVLMQLLFAFLLSCLSYSVAEAVEQKSSIHLLLSGDGQPYQNFEIGFREAADDQLLDQLTVSQGNTDITAQNNEEYDLVVAVGMRALRWSLDNDETPLIAAMVPALSLSRLMTDSPDRIIGGLYIDQPLQRHLALIQAVLPEKQHVGIITRNEEQALRYSLNEAVDGRGMTLHHRQAEDRESLIEAVQALAREVDVLLVMPSTITQDPPHLRALLLQSFRERLPVFSYSPGLVSAGSLIAVHSLPQELGRETAEDIMNHRDQSLTDWPDPRYPKHLALTRNRDVARALRIRIPSDDVIQLKLENE